MPTDWLSYQVPGEHDRHSRHDQSCVLVSDEQRRAKQGPQEAQVRPANLGLWRDVGRVSGRRRFSLNRFFVSHELYRFFRIKNR